MALRKKYDVEVHRMTGSKPIPKWCKVQGKGRVYLTTFFKGVGIKLKLRQQEDLPRSDFVTDSDLHAWLEQFLNLAADPPVIHVFVVTEYSGDDPDDSEAVGLMFDESQRSALAIFDWGNPNNANRLLTALHELTHVFNLHHEDGEPSGGRATIEGDEAFAVTDWRLGSHARNKHFDEPPNTVWPGPQGTPFGHVIQSHLDSHMGASVGNSTDFVAVP